MMAPNELAGGGAAAMKDTSRSSERSVQQQQQEASSLMCNTDHHNIDALGHIMSEFITTTTTTTTATSTSTIQDTSAASAAAEQDEHGRKKASISSSSTSSMLTNSIASPSSSLTSILTNSPTSTTAEFSSTAASSANRFVQTAATITSTAAMASHSSTDPAAAAAAVPSIAAASPATVSGTVDSSNRIATTHCFEELRERQQEHATATTTTNSEALPLQATDSSSLSPHLEDVHVAQQELGDGPRVVELLRPTTSDSEQRRRRQQQHEQQQFIAADGAPRGSLEQLAHHQTATTTVDLLATAASPVCLAANPSSQPNLIEDQQSGNPPTITTRLERSNSCSQAIERQSATLGGDSSSLLLENSPLFNATTSLSPENLASSSSLNNISREDTNEQEQLAQDNVASSQKERHQPSQPINIVNNHHNHKNSSSASAEGSPPSLHDDSTSSTAIQQQPQLSSSFKEKSSYLQSKVQQEQQQQQQQKQQLQQPAASSSSSFASTSSRFFSSKLNTGSLWSLLSAGSSSSSIMNDQSFDQHQPQSVGGDHSNEKQQNSTTNNMQEMAALVASKSSSFLNRYHNQFKTSKQSTAAPGNHSSFDNNSWLSSSSSAAASHTANSQPRSASIAHNSLLSSSSGGGDSQQQQQQLDRRRYRFNVKYIGSALLHRNFTLPMLEWIAKDIRRQTIRGAQSTTQRQFTIPSREIILELQLNQLTAISCKDSHCLFVHPMHCVSKYVQLQHDSTCFAYIIRDNKDSPSFCHVFQAKNTSKIHEIFSAIREVATRSQIQSINNHHHQQGDYSSQTANGSQTNCRLQKSASTDGHWRSLLTNTTTATAATNTHDTPTTAGPKSPPILSLQQQQQHPMAPPSPPPLPPPSTTAALYLRQQQQQQQQQQQLAAQSLQFDNSYQFEVMFIKRVKLQCRRVPPTFVDDALETLKSFEVLKGNHHHHMLIGDHHSKSSQIKGIVGKRIINASVDERQEYDESCQSPTGAAPSSGGNKPSLGPSMSDGNGGQQQQDNLTTDRRASSVSLSSRAENDDTSTKTAATGGESKSCQQSPTATNNKSSVHHQATSVSQYNVNDDGGDKQSTATVGASNDAALTTAKPIRKISSSIDCLMSLDSLKYSGQQQPPASYANDFSPYNTITSSDLNERIAAIPVVSSSVSLDHETRQKLARQVRETIQATAANIKRGVYASGDKLDSSTSSKALDSLSCNISSSVPSVEDSIDTTTLAAQLQQETADENQNGEPIESSQDFADSNGHRRSSACATGLHNQSANQHPAVGNNFDLFRRASARQVVKNRTMLLLIGKDELCAISIDKHQMLFSKSFNSIVHCLQGNTNRDHFGLICRDSGKINPNTETHAGYVFRCQSEKVVREIMGALKQVIYSSQHNYHGYNSPYNPLNSVASRHQHHHQQQQQLPFVGAKVVTTTAVATATTSKQPQSASELAGRIQVGGGAQQGKSSVVSPSTTSSKNVGELSLAAKRGFAANPIELDEAAKLAASSSSSSTPAHKQISGGVNQQAARAQPPTAPIIGQPAGQFHAPAKNLIKSMFCDNCPLYWYHRLCCDVESLPAEASKAIILRRIDSSLSDKEQDEVYSRFSEFNIESIEEHNEIFMSLLRQQCERKQTKHGQSQAHLNAMAKNASLARQMTNPSIESSSRSLSATREATTTGLHDSKTGHAHHHHQRSDSSGGSLAHLLSGGAGQSSSQHQQIGQQQSSSLADASSLAIDNLKRAKNSISISIENMLKRRSSTKDEQEAIDDQQQQQLTNQLGGSGHPPSRSGSFKSAQGRESRSANAHHQQQQPNAEDSMSIVSNGQTQNNLKRSQSTTDHSCQSNGSSTAQRVAASSWRDSLSRTINESTDLSSNSLVGFFRRRGSMSKDNQQPAETHHQRAATISTGVSNESLCDTGNKHQSRLEPASRDSRQQSPSRLSVGGAGGGGTSSPSSMLSGVFWKKSIFDKIRQPISDEQAASATTAAADAASKAANDQPPPPPSRQRTKEELRSLWRKAIFEQITLLKMDKQNQKLQARAASSSATSSHGPNPPSVGQTTNNIAPGNDVGAAADDQVDCCNIQRIKLDYRDVPFGKEAPKLWSRLLKQDPTKKVDFLEVARLVRLGVPKMRRGEVWMFLMNQYQLRHGTSFQPADRDYHGDANQTYRSLLTQLSTQQHEIFVDIGRTFPSHPYYSQYLSIGQLSLFNLLKAYSLLDREVGYCQGLSFVAGILLLHVDSEDEAFELMRHLLFNFGLRKQYLPSMNALHLQLYQMTRLLRDHEYDLFVHFDHHDISPSLYAAPWFLTLFASQFPLGFVARLLDLIFLIGIEAIFRISLKLLAYHRNSILACSSLEATMEFMRGELIKINDKDMADLFDKSMSMDLRNKLIEYEIEYSFYCAEDKARMINNAIRNSQLGKPTTTSDENELLPKSSEVADATATVIIQHLLANNHLKSLKTDYSY